MFRLPMVTASPDFQPSHSTASQFLRFVLGLQSPMMAFDIAVELGGRLQADSDDDQGIFEFSDASRVSVSTVIPMTAKMVPVHAKRH